MRLWYAPTSPFARKTRIAAHELGLAERIELVEVNPWTDGRLRAFNPLAKVPTLERECRGWRTGPTPPPGGSSPTSGGRRTSGPRR
jgi:hypothetical protein